MLFVITLASTFLWEIAVPANDISAFLRAPVQAATDTSIGQIKTEAREENSKPAMSLDEADDTLRPFEDVISGLKKVEGLFTLYYSDDKRKAFLALEPQQLNQNFLLVATLAAGLGEAGLYRGWPINDGIVQFRAIPGNKLQLIIPNVYFRSATNEGEQLREQSFSDSILYALNIVSRQQNTGTLLVDLGELLINRDPANLFGRFAWILGSYVQNQEASYLSQLDVFPENLEAEAELTFTGSGTPNSIGSLLGLTPESLPDARGFSLRVHYSFSQLPDNPRYTPRPADERVGYFLSVYRPSNRDGPQGFKRYIHRWHLEKKDSHVALSRPIKPIVFWLENTVPEAYREALKEGVLMWNAAFERAGFSQAIEVRQMPNDADWDPADVRYNVIRWSDSFRSWAIGLGPSRVNPLTGEILDADVILDANVVQLLQRQFNAFVAPSDDAQIYLQLCGHPLQDLYTQWLSGRFDLKTWQQRRHQPAAMSTDGADKEEFCNGFTGAQQIAFGALSLLNLRPFEAPDRLESYIQQYLRALTAHEVGHVLGLRHNFLGSTLLSPEELNQPEVIRDRGLVSSIMDYFPPNLAAPGQPQGDYFPTRLGAYDLWAIEYGYKPLEGPLPHLNHSDLQRIANRGQTPEFAYATDEDIYDFLDPLADAWDLSSNPLQYAEGQLAHAQALWAKLDWYFVMPGEGYGQLRSQVDLVFSYYLQQALTATNYIGGQRFTRTDPWASRGRRPFQLVPADQQRQALSVLAEYLFAPDAFRFSPELINSLAPERWRHWGQRLSVYPLDYPIYDRISFIQSIVLSDLLYSERLLRLRDVELRANGEDVFTLAELFEHLGSIVWGEIMDHNQSPNSIHPLRRSLQRQHLTILTNLVLRGYSGIDNAQSFGELIGAATTLGAPEDARVLARYQLSNIRDAVEKSLRGAPDLATRAHLEAIDARISKVLEAPLQAY